MPDRALLNAVKEDLIRIEQIAKRLNKNVNLCIKKGGYEKITEEFLYFVNGAIRSFLKELKIMQSYKLRESKMKLENLIKEILSEESQEELEKKLHDAMKHYDWHYQMSDDSRVWRKGSENDKQVIIPLIQRIGEKQGIEIFNSYASQRAQDQKIKSIKQLPRA